MIEYEVGIESRMEDKEPFDCCPTIGRHISYTHVVQRPSGGRRKSLNPVDKVLTRLRPIEQNQEIRFKEADQVKKPRDVSKATVSAVSVKPYKQWLDSWQPGDALPFIPPGFRINLCDDIGNGKLVDRSIKDKPSRFGPMNESELAVSEMMSQKSLGPKIKDSIYSLLSMVAKSRGLWVDDKNKLRCPPGTPNANQFTDITGSNCLIPVAIKPKGVATSGARLARRVAADGLVGAMNAGARVYPEGIGRSAVIGRKENIQWGRSTIRVAETMRQDFKDGRFMLPSGQIITGFSRNNEGKRNFLMAVSELMPSVNRSQAEEFWDSMLDENTPLTTLQKVQMEDYIDGYFQSWFFELANNPTSTGRLVTHLNIQPPDYKNAWDIKLAQPSNPNAPVTESGFQVQMNFNPVAAYYTAKNGGGEEFFFGHGEGGTMRSAGVYTGTHEFGHLQHFARALSNIGFDPATLVQNSRGEWNIDLRNISNPTGSPSIARLQAMVARIEAFQSGNRMETLASGQRVRRTVKDYKESVSEFYQAFFGEFINDLGGSPEQLELLARFAGTKYGNEGGPLEARPEAYAVMRLHGPQTVKSFAREHAIYQAENPSVYPSPDTEAEIENQVYEALNNVFYGPGGRTRDKFHERNDATGRSSISAAVVPPGAPGVIAPSPGGPARAPSPRGGLISRFMPRSGSRTPPPGGSLTGPMTSRRQVGRSVSTGLTGALAGQTKNIYEHRPRNSDLMPVSFDGKKASEKIDTDVIDLISTAGIINNSVGLDDIIQDGQVLIEADNVLERIADAASVVVAQIDGDSEDGVINNISGKRIANQVERKYSQSNRAAKKLNSNNTKNLEEKYKFNIENNSSRITEITKLQDQIRKDRTNPRNEEKIAELAYPGMSLDETVKVLLAKNQISLQELDSIRKDEALRKSDPDAFVMSRKQRIQDQILASLAAVRKSTQRMPELSGSIIDFRVVDGGRERNKASIVSLNGKLVPKVDMNINPREVEISNHPNYGVATANSVSDISRSSKLSKVGETYHEIGHVFDYVSQLDSLGIKTGVDSPKAIDQIKAAGPQLGDSVAGALFALATGKSVSADIDSMSDYEKSLIPNFLIGAIASGTPRDSAQESSRIKNLIFSGIDVGAVSGSKNSVASYSGSGFDMSRTKSSFEKFGKNVSINKSQYEKANRISNRINEIVSESLGYEFNNGVFGNPGNIFGRNGLAAQSSQYAKMNGPERFAETFALSMMDAEIGLELNGPDGVRARQLAGAMSAMVRDRSSRDSIATLTPEQKLELEDLQKNLKEVIEIDYDSIVNDLEKFRPEQDSRTNIENNEGLVGALSANQKEASQKFASFETSQGSVYTYGEDGRVSRQKSAQGSTMEASTSSLENTIFVDYETQRELWQAFQRGKGLREDGSLHGQKYDASGLNGRAFNKLRSGKLSDGQKIPDHVVPSFDVAYEIAGGKITETKPKFSYEPEVGLFVFEWDSNGRYHPGNEVINVTTRPGGDKPTGLVGALASKNKLSEVTGAEMPAAGRQGTYGMFPRGVWKEEDHFPMADEMRTAFMDATDFESIAPMYEKISADWGISPREVQRHINELSRRVYYDEPFIIPPEQANVPRPNTRRKQVSRATPRTPSPKQIPDSPSGLTGAMSDRPDSISAGVEKRESLVADAKSRVQNLEKAIDDFEKTGDWNGAKHSVVLALSSDPNSPSIDPSDTIPKDKTAAELAAAGEEKGKMLERAKEKLFIAKEELALQEDLEKAKKLRIEQNVLDIEDLTDEDFDELVKEQKELLELREKNPKEFNKLFAPTEGELIVAHVGASELDGGVLDPDKTQGKGGGPGTPGDTQALNAMQIKKIKETVTDSEKLVKRGEELVALLRDKKRIDVTSRDDTQLLYVLERSLMGSNLGETLKIGSTIDLSSVDEAIFPGLYENGVRGPERKIPISDIIERAINGFDGINSKIKYSKEQADAVRPLLARIEESPRSGFLSAYGIDGPLTSRGYFGRYSQSSIPKNLSGVMQRRWERSRRGTQWLVKGKIGRDISGSYGASDEMQIFGVNKPMFGISSDLSSNDIDSVSLAIAARVAKLSRNNKEVSPRSVLSNVKNVQEGKINSGNPSDEVVGGLTGAMSVDKRQKLAEESTNRVAKLEQALKILEETGEWKGADVGVIVSRVSDHRLDSIDDPEAIPNNKTKAELEALPGGVEAIKKRVKEKLATAILERDFQDRLLKAKQTRIRQNVLDIEDISPEQIETLKEESAAIRRMDKNTFYSLASGVDGREFAIHAGSPELDGDLLNSDRTVGDEKDSVMYANTQKINKEMITTYLLEQERDEKKIEISPSIRGKLSSGEKFSVSSNEELQILQSLGAVDRRSGKLGDSVDLKEQYGQNYETALASTLQQLDSDLEERKKTVERRKKIVQVLKDNPKSGYLSSSPLAAGDFSTRGYFGRYSDSAIPKDVAIIPSEREKATGLSKEEIKNEFMYQRWKANLRGTAWLVDGETDSQITSDFGPRGSERQILGSMKPEFGVSAKREDSFELDEIGMALMIRAAQLKKEGKPVTPESVLNHRVKPFGDGLTGAMSTSAKEWPSYQNFYSVLGVSNNATPKDIKRSYLLKAKSMHPDVDKSPGATERFQELQKAYETLSDLDNRKKYDSWAAGEINRPRTGPAGSAETTRTDRPRPQPSRGQTETEEYGEDWPSAPFDDSTVFPTRALSTTEFDEMWDYLQRQEQPNRVGKPPRKKVTDDNGDSGSRSGFGFNPSPTPPPKDRPKIPIVGRPYGVDELPEDIIASGEAEIIDWLAKQRLRDRFGFGA